MKICIPFFLLVLTISGSLNSSITAESLDGDTKASYNFQIKDLSAVESKLKALEDSTMQKLDLAEQDVSKEEQVMVREVDSIDVTQERVQVKTVDSLEERDAELIHALANTETPVEQAEVLAPVAETVTSEEQALISELQASLAQSRNESSSSLSLKKKLQKTQANLKIAETEVERLSSILEDHNRKILGLKPVKVKKAVRKQDTSSMHFASLEKKAKQSIKKVIENTDLPVVTVNVDKANLRTGPGIDHSPLMEVAKGSRLVIEKREGEWLRVIAPNGNRAWISSTVITFGQGSLNQGNIFQSPTRTVNVQGFDSRVEHTRLSVF